MYNHKFMFRIYYISSKLQMRTIVHRNMSGGAGFGRRGDDSDEVDQAFMHTVVDILSFESLDDSMDLIMAMISNDCGFPYDKERRTLDKWIDFFVSKRAKETDKDRKLMMNTVARSLSIYKDNLERRERNRAAKAATQQGEGGARTSAPEQGEGAAIRAAPMTLERLTAPVNTTAIAIRRGQDIFDTLLSGLDPDMIDIVVGQIQHNCQLFRLHRLVNKVSPPSDDKSAVRAKRRRDDDGRGGA